MVVNDGSRLKEWNRRYTRLKWVSPGGWLASALGIWWEVQSSVRGLGVDPLLFCIERSQLSWFRHLVRIPPGHLPRVMFQEYKAGKRPQRRPGFRWRDDISALTWNVWDRAARADWCGQEKGSLGRPAEPATSGTRPDKRLIMNGWADRWIKQHSHKTTYLN